MSKELEGFELISAEGYNDGYYWDYRVIFKWNDKCYAFIDVGSGSGYYPCHSSIIHFNPGDELLKGAREKDHIDNDILDYIDGDWSYFIECAEALDESGEDEYVILDDSEDEEDV